MSQPFSAESMEPSTSWKWRLTVDHKNTLPTKQAPNTELDTVMLNAPTTSNSSMEKPTQKIGLMTKVTMDLAVQSWISGRPTNTLMLTLPILAKLQDTTDAKEVNVETAAKDRTVSVIKTDVT